MREWLFMLAGSRLHQLPTRLNLGLRADVEHRKVRKSSSRADHQFVPPGGHALAGPWNVPLDENLPPAPTEGAPSSLKYQLKKASSCIWYSFPFIVIGGIKIPERGSPTSQLS